MHDEAWRKNTKEGLATVENRIKEPRFFLSSLDRFLTNGFVLIILARKVLNKVLIYSTCFP